MFVSRFRRISEITLYNLSEDAGPALKQKSQDNTFKRFAVFFTRMPENRVSLQPGWSFQQEKYQGVAPELYKYYAD
jgi:hypothetical protein